MRSLEKTSMNDRTRFRWACLLFVSLLGGSHALGLTLTLSTPTAGINTFDLELTTGLLSDSDSSTASGTIDVQLQYFLDHGDATVTGLEFTDGNVNFDDIDFSLGFGLLTIEGENVSGTLESLTVPSPVVDGDYDATQHQLTVNQGTFVSMGLANLTIDVSEMPFGGPGSGFGTVTISELSRNDYSVTYETTVFLPIAFTGNVQETPVSVDLDMTGSIEATGLWSIPIGGPGDYDLDGDVDQDDYTTWATNFGSNDPVIDGNGDGVVNAPDYTIWRDHYVPGEPPASIPEPAAWLIATGLGLVSPRRER